MRHRAGFTLIELSIVLVIIALIAGGVLVGRDLIEAAKIRQQISQIEQFKAAVNTFRTKYNAIPGDMLASSAGAFGFQQRSGGPGDGDGNGILEPCVSQQSTDPSDFASYETDFFGCETALFWRDLSDANLIAGNFTGDVDGFIEIDEGQQQQFIPAAKIGNGNFIMVYGGVVGIMPPPPPSPPPNYLLLPLSGDAISYAIVQVPTTVASGQFDPTISGGPTPRQAFAIDTKMDDGMPETGAVLSGQSSGGLVGLNLSPNVIKCAISNDGNLTFYYQTGAATADMPVCVMSFH